MLAVSKTKCEDPPFFGSTLRMKVSPGSGWPGHPRTTRRSPSSFSNIRGVALGAFIACGFGPGGANTHEDRTNTGKKAGSSHGTAPPKYVRFGFEPPDSDHRGETLLHTSFRVQVLTSHRETQRSASLEHPPLAHQEIPERARRDGHRVGQQIVHVALADHHFHKSEVAEDGNGSTSEVEAQEPGQRTTPAGLHSVRLPSIRLRSVGPGELLVPDEVMHHRGLHGDRSRREIVQVQHALQQKQRGELHRDANSADKVELAPSH